MNWNRIITGTFAGLFGAVAVYAGMFFLELHRDLNAMQAQEMRNRERLETARARLAEQEAYLERLRNDPALIEQVIRRKLGYVRDGEYVFRFEESPLVGDR